ncbi:hypothetical protein BJ138DRAFT_1141785 [Hygrophoropsis aurantiaca]|uniref:Uncharacterized protein n=1 Tax=Hygrophoropsis aurantiaca TaxID=72124 RepID=A0ACB8AQH1_9AGAM|nr:hypothetical protein BJ138DRAFT_1141785 [Hygrophoropsis aurantiaca]
MNNDNDDQGSHRTHRFGQGLHIPATLQNMLRNINHAFTHNNHANTSQSQEDHMDGLEPSTSSQHQETSSHQGASAQVISGQLESGPTSGDVEMEPPVVRPSQTIRPERDDDNDSMPELQSVSDESDESDHDALEVEAMPAARPVDDDHDSAWTDDEEDLPPLEPIAGSRRARVEDDVDEARDRRHPSERAGIPAPNGPPQPQPSNQQQPQFDVAQGLFDGLFNAFNRGGNSETETGEGNANLPPPGNNASPRGPLRGVPVLTAGFAFTIPMAGPLHIPRHGGPTGPNPAGQGPNPTQPGNNNPQDGEGREDFIASIAAFFQEMQTLGQLDDNREDPERAKKLVAGLEVVPIGLVKRMERVGGTLGGHVDGAEEMPNGPGCAICWDSLLDAESDSFRPKEAAESTGTDGEPTNTVEDNEDVQEREHSLSEGSASASLPVTADEPKIISLPCAHVFHASCLLPWFSRAKNATCPTCRFNIDPENLTYTPRQIFAPPPATDNTRNSAATPDVPAPTATAPPAPSASATVITADNPTGDGNTAPAAQPTQQSPLDPIPAPAPTATGPAPPPAHAHTAFTFATPGAGIQFPGAIPFNIPGLQAIFPLAGLGAQPTQSDVPATGSVPDAPPDGQRNPNPQSAQRMRAQSMPNIFPPGSQPPLPAGEFVTIGVDMFVGAPVGDMRPENGAPPTQEMHTFLQNLFRGRGGTTQFFNGHHPHTHDEPPTTTPAAHGPDPTQATNGPQPPPQVFAHWLPRHPHHMHPRRERKTWTVPLAPGPSLRQRVEQKEREADLRCFDISCGIGPSDDDPFPDISTLSLKQVSITPLPSTEIATVGAHVCSHKFHPACLVSAERVAGWGGEDKTEPQVEVSCPVCRAVGCVTRGEWEEGVSSL